MVDAGAFWMNRSPGFGVLEGELHQVDRLVQVHEEAGHVGAR